MKKITIILVILILILILISVYFVILKFSIASNNPHTLEGVIEQVNSKSLLIIPTNNRNIGDKVAVHISNVKLSASEKARLVVGLKIKIKYSGEVMESYPVQINAQDIEFFN